MSCQAKKWQHVIQLLHQAPTISPKFLEKPTGWVVKLWDFLVLIHNTVTSYVCCGISWHISHQAEQLHILRTEPVSVVRGKKGDGITLLGNCNPLGVPKKPWFNVGFTHIWLLDGTQYYRVMKLIQINLLLDSLSAKSIRITHLNHSCGSESMSIRIGWHVAKHCPTCGSPNAPDVISKIPIETTNGKRCPLAI